MEESFSHLKEYEWICDIWLPNDLDQRFTGKISYKPSYGIQFEIHVQGDTQCFKDAKIFYGNSFEVGQFTLTGCMRLNSSSTSYISKVNMFASYIIFGGHFPDDASFQGCKFNFNGLDDFCGGVPHTEDLKDFESVILDGDFKNLNFSIKKLTSGFWINENKVSEQFLFDTCLTDNLKQKLVSELNASFSKILNKYPSTNVFTKGNTNYECFLISENSSLKLHDLIIYTNNLVNLFSLILINPCLAIDIKVINEDVSSNGDTYMKDYSVLTSVHLSEYEYHQANDTKWNPFFNFSATDIKENFHTTLTTWEELLDNPLDLTLNVIREHIKNSYNVAQHVVVCISALEQWHANYGDKSCMEKKYDYMLQKYATPALEKKLREYLPLKIGDEERLGEVISRLRGIILHPNGVRKLKYKQGKSLDDATLHNLSEVLIVILIRAVYTRFGIPKSVISRIGGPHYTVLHEHFVIEQ